jgi:pimeloyl-ACP methyl ester carboxylesterase
MDGHFTGGYRRIVIEGAGHFPLREAPDAVADALFERLVTAG